MSPQSKMTTIESLLGVLSLKPMSGYEMRQFMEGSTANFWSESFGQIYPALKVMLSEGLATMEEQTVEGRVRKVYRLTEAGERRLRNWLGMPAKTLTRRHELLLKVFFGDKAEQGAVKRQLVLWRAMYAADVQRYGALEEGLQREHAGQPGLPYWLMTLRYGLAEARMVVGWCDECLGELERQEVVRQEVGSRK